MEQNIALSPQLQHKRSLAFLLSSLLVSYPDDGFISCVTTVLENPEVERNFEEVAPENWPLLKAYLNEICADPDAVRELAGAYIDLFERNRPTTSLYETEYGLGRAVAKGNELLDIATMYQAFGLEIGDNETGREMVDHLGVELEFYALMGLKREALLVDGDQEGVAIVSDGATKFLRDHLGTFTSSILNRPGVLNNSFYFHAMKCIDLLIADECQRLGVEQASRPWEDNLLLEGEEISCGVGGCLSGNPQTPTLPR